MFLDGHTGEVRTLPDGGDDVLHFQRGVGRQDDVGIEAVILQPRMLGHDALDARVFHGLDGPVAVVPTGDAAGRISPDHVDRDAAVLLRDGVGVPIELFLGLAFLAAAAVEDQGRFENGVLNERFGDELGAPGVHRGPTRFGESLR